MIMVLSFSDNFLLLYSLEIANITSIFQQDSHLNIHRSIELQN